MFKDSAQHWPMLRKFIRVFLGSVGEVGDLALGITFWNWRMGTYRNMLHSLHQVFSWKKWPQAFSPCSFECLMSGVRTSTGSLQSSKVRDCSSFSRCLQVTHHSEGILWCFQHLQASGAVDTSMTRHSFTWEATTKPYHQDSTGNMHATPDTACEPV